MERNLKEIEMRIKLFLQSATIVRIPLNFEQIEQILEEVWKVCGEFRLNRLKLSLSYLHVGEFRLNYTRF
jgi:hypothetical protein